MIITKTFWLLCWFMLVSFLSVVSTVNSVTAPHSRLATTGLSQSPSSQSWLESKCRLPQSPDTAWGETVPGIWWTLSLPHTCSNATTFTSSFTSSRSKPQMTWGQIPYFHLSWAQCKVHSLNRVNISLLN